MKPKLKKKKNNVKNEEITIDFSFINFLKLKLLFLCLSLIIIRLIAKKDHQIIYNKNKDIELFKNILELYITKGTQFNNDFTVYVKDYIIKINFLISDNEYQITKWFFFGGKY